MDKPEVRFKMSFTDFLNEGQKMENRKVPVEVYSRVVGYFRPVNQWNKGKQEEFAERQEYKIKKEAADEKQTA